MVKVPANKIDGFLRTLDPSIRSVLFYGPDEGQVRERAKALSVSICPDQDDPFRMADIAPSSLKDDPAKVVDECSAIAFGGGQRVVRISGLTDAQAGPVLKYVTDPIGDSVLIVTAGTLAPKSKLRAAFETTNTAAAIACYPLEGNRLKATLQGAFQSEKVDIDHDALELLASLLADDTASLRSEVEKLCIYALSGDQPISIDDVRKSCGDQSAHTAFELAHAVAEGNHPTIQDITDRLLVSGDNPIAIVRNVSRHFDRLLQARGNADQGAPLDAAIKSLRPPVFFKDAGRFRQQVGLWSSQGLLMAITRLLDIEKSCKTTGSPAAIMLQRGLLEIASLAKRQKNRR